MNSRNRKVLSHIFEKPERSDIKWKAIETLIKALGGDVRQGKGLRIHFILNDVVATFHTPHPESETDKGAVKSVRKYLEDCEIRP